MERKLFAGLAAFALCIGSATPAAAQDRRFAGFDARPGASATVNLRVPLGAASRRSRPTVGLTLGLGRTMGGGIDGAPIVRQVPLVDLRFSESGLARARVASFDLAGLDRYRRLNLDGGKKNSLLLVGAVAAAAAAAACVVAGCFDDDDEDTDNDEGGAETPTSG